MLWRALMLKVVSWIILSPAYAVAQPPQPSALPCRCTRVHVAGMADCQERDCAL